MVSTHITPHTYETYIPVSLLTQISLIIYIYYKWSAIPAQLESPEQPSLAPSESTPSALITAESAEASNTLTLHSSYDASIFEHEDKTKVRRPKDTRINLDWDAPIIHENIKLKNLSLINFIDVTRKELLQFCNNENIILSSLSKHKVALCTEVNGMIQEAKDWYGKYYYILKIYPYKRLPYLHFYYCLQLFFLLKTSNFAMMYIHITRTGQVVG